MTTMTSTPPEPSGLLAEVIAIQCAPTCAERQNIRRDADLTVSRLAREVGVTPSRIRQYERTERLPATPNSLRYLNLLSQLKIQMQELKGVRQSLDATPASSP